MRGVVYQRLTAGFFWAFIAIILAITLGCGGRGIGLKVPKPDLKYGWSQPLPKTMSNGETLPVVCLTQPDRDLIFIYINALESYTVGE